MILHTSIFVHLLLCLHYKISNLYLKRPSMLQCINLMRSENSKDVRNLSLFLINIFCLYKWYRVNQWQIKIISAGTKCSYKWYMVNQIKIKIMFVVMEQWHHAGTYFLLIFAMSMIIFIFYNIYFLHAYILIIRLLHSIVYYILSDNKNCC